MIGLGTVKFGRNEGVKYPHAFELPSYKDLQTLMAHAKSLGVNVLDTAPAYGESEERLGKLLEGQRKDWIISTKVGEFFKDGLSFFDFSSKSIGKSIEQSLKRLQTDYLDIVLIHSNGDDVRLIEEEKVFESLQRAKDAGKILAFGMSTKTLEGGMFCIEQSDLAMITYNINDTSQEKIIQYAKQKQKGIFIKKALMSGHLKNHHQNYSAKEAVQFVLQQEGVTSVIVGTLNPSHLSEIASVIA